MKKSFKFLAVFLSIIISASGLAPMGAVNSPEKLPDSKEIEKGYQGEDEKDNEESEKETAKKRPREDQSDDFKGMMQEKRLEGEPQEEQAEKSEKEQTQEPQYGQQLWSFESQSSETPHLWPRREESQFDQQIMIWTPSEESQEKQKPVDEEPQRQQEPSDEEPQRQQEPSDEELQRQQEPLDEESQVAQDPEDGESQVAQDPEDEESQGTQDAEDGESQGAQDPEDEESQGAQDPEDGESQGEQDSEDEESLRQQELLRRISEKNRRVSQYLDVVIEDYKQKTNMLEVLKPGSKFMLIFLTESFLFNLNEIKNAFLKGVEFLESTVIQQLIPLRDLNLIRDAYGDQSQLNVKALVMGLRNLERNRMTLNRDILLNLLSISKYTGKRDILTYNPENPDQPPVAFFVNCVYMYYANGKITMSLYYGADKVYESEIG